MGTVTYRWYADGKEVGQGASYTLKAEDKGKIITVKAEYTDGKGTAESVESARTAEVADDGQNPPPNPPQPGENHAGTVTVTGEAKTGSTLSATVSDQDGVPTDGVSYQWLRDGQPIAHATQSKYTLTNDDLGHKVSVKVSYTDNAQHAESVTSTATESVTDGGQTPPPNPQPPQPGENHAGTVTVTGEAKTGSTLSATVSDQDGVPTDGVSYQWLRDGQPIAHATQSKYTLTNDDLGHKVSVKVSYTDNAQHAESVTSTATENVTDGGQTPPPNPQPPQPGENHAGQVTVTGEAKTGSTLSATVSDQDGVPTEGVKYQWQRDGQDIDGATGKTYRLTAADAGHKITVKASYEDNAHHAENPESVATDVAANPAPQSEPVLSLQGAASVKEGEAANYTVSLNRATDHDVTLEVEIGSDKASNVRAETRTVTIPKGETSTTFTVETHHDGQDTPRNAFSIHLKNAQGATLASQSESNPTHGSGGEESQITEERTFSAAGQTGTYRLSAVGNSDTHPDGLICYLHGDSAEEYNGSPSLSNYGELSAYRGALLLSVKTPDSTTGNWSKNGEDNAQYLRALIEDIQSKYNIDKGNIWFIGYEGGADLITNHLLPQHNDLFSGGGALMIGGGNVNQPLTFSKTPSQSLKEHFQMKWLTGSEDADGLVAAQQGQARYSEAGFHTQRENIPGIGHDESGRGEYGAGVLDGLYTGKNLNGMTTSIDDIDHVNRPPTDIELVEFQNNELIEGKDGLKIGSLLVSDPDTAYHSYTVSDARFEITANGVLKLKNDQHFDFAKEPTIKLTITADDGQGGTFSKEFTLQVKDDPNWPTPQPQTNRAGTVSITGEAKVGSELTADVKDEDGVPDNGITYQWQRDGQPIDGATGRTYRLTADDAGHKITVKATYSDNAHHAENPMSEASDIAANPPAEQPTVSISGSDKVNEGEAATYTVTLDRASDQPVTVTVTLKHGETTDADFAQPVTKTLTIPAGQTSATFSINTADDKLPENDEKYTVEISAPQGAKLDAAKTSVTTHIVDNDETAANHNGTNTETAFAGDRNAETPYFVKTLDSGYNGSGHLAGHKPGEGLNVTYAFATTPQDEKMQGFQPFSEQQKAGIRTVLDHIAEHVNVKYTEGDNATLNFYKNEMDGGIVGRGVYGGNVYLSAKSYSADDAFRNDIPYKLEADDKLTQYTGWHAALHEVGHTLALNHTFKNKAPTPNLDTVEDRDDLSVMSYTAGEHVASVPRHDGGAWINVPIPQNKLGIFDLAALHHSFGVNPDYHNGDDTYTFKEFNKDAIGNDIYIHDGGGLDTFDASEQTLDLNIDLTPGSWIHAGEKTSHLVYNDDGTLTHGQMFIGYGTQIENAKGGSGNDTIKGNSAANYLFGFDGDDTIDGGAGNDQLEGGRGADTLTGGKGADTFIFASPLDGKADTITDFNFSEGDILQLDHNIFTALEKGTLAADQFVAGKEAKDENDHLLYDRTTGELAYDPDGSGSAAAVTIARLGANHDLEHNGIHII